MGSDGLGLWGDRQETVQIAIASGSTGNTTLLDPRKPSRWAIYYLYVQNTDGTNTTTFYFASGSTQITGTLSLTAGVALEIKTAPYPALIGKLRDNDLVLNKTGSGTLQGWAIVGEVR